MCEQLLPHVFFLLRLKLKWLRNDGWKGFIATCTYSQESLPSLKCKFDIVLSVPLPPNRNLMKLEKRS